MALFRLPKAIDPAARLARQKREFERYLRAQGWSRREAAAAVAQKFAAGGKPK